MYQRVRRRGRSPEGPSRSIILPVLLPLLHQELSSQLLLHSLHSYLCFCSCSPRSSLASSATLPALLPVLLLQFPQELFSQLLSHSLHSYLCFCSCSPSSYEPAPAKLPALLPVLLLLLPK